MLTDLKVKNLKFEGKVAVYADADGLYLRISKTKKRWQLAFNFKGQSFQFYHDKSYPDLSLSEARKWASDTRSKVESGVTGDFQFGRFVREYRQKMKRDDLADATLKKFDLRVEKYLKSLLEEDIREIKPLTMLSLLREIESKGKYEAMRQTLQMASNSFLMAKIAGVIVSNPCEGLHKALATGKTKSRAAIIDPLEFGKLLSDVEDKLHPRVSLQVKTALELHPLLAARPEEIRELVWSEVDFERKIISLSAERMKMEEPHIIPLPHQAIEKLKRLKGKMDCPYVFAMSNGKPYSDVILRGALISLGYHGAHQRNLEEGAKRHGPHGYRASFRTICDEVLEWRTDVLEQQLAHLVKDANGTAYNRTKFLDKRMVMMQLWADFCDVLKKQDKDAIDAFIKQYKGAI